MENSKFLKAKCKKIGRYYGLEIKQIQGLWKVVNMTDLSDSDAGLIASEIKQDTFESNDNLIACQKCGNRRVGGCNCAKKKHQCSKNMKYCFDCLYCDEFEIDYNIPTARPDQSRKVGDTVILSQGQEVQIKYSDDRPLTQIYVGVGWDPASLISEKLFGTRIDVDSSVVVMSSQSLQYELVYYRSLKHRSGCVKHHGDNLTGKNSLFGILTNSDDENISVYLDKVPENRDGLIFVLNIFKCVERRQTFGKIKNLYIKLYDPCSKKVMVEYKVTGNFMNDTALIIGKAYRKDGTWFFKAIGKGSRATSVEQLAAESVMYCR